MVSAAAATAIAAPSIETIETLLDVTYTWGYQETRAKLRDLYDKIERGLFASCFKIADMRRLQTIVYILPKWGVGEELWITWWNMKFRLQPVSAHSAILLRCFPSGRP